MMTTHLRRFSLLFASLLIGFISFFQMFARVNGSIPNSYKIMLPIVALLFMALWVLLEIFQPYASQTILPCVVVLSSLGVTLIARIDLHNIKINQPTHVGLTQLIWLCLALVLCGVLVVTLRDYRVLRKFSYVSMVVGLALLLSPMLPVVGREIGGARIWIGIGSHTIQPGEFAKLFLAFFFAAYLFDHRDQLAVGGHKVLGMRMPRIKDLGPIIIVWLVSLGVLVIQHDLGTSLMYFAMFVSMLYVATGRTSWIAIGAVFFIGGAIVATTVFPHVGARVDAWLHPFSDLEYNKEFGGSGQLVRGIFGLATGGLTGTGLGQGRPWITPLANSDFIYSSTGEELGLSGLLVVLTLYLIIVASGMITAMKIKDGFGKLLASGLVFTMAFQVFTVVGGITLVIPLTGLTMPYMAAGGSSLIANCLLAGLLIIISNASNKPAPEVSSDTFQYQALEVLHQQDVDRKKEDQASAESRTHNQPQKRQARMVTGGESSADTSQFPMNEARGGENE